MPSVGMTDVEKLMKEKISNYSGNVQELARLEERLKNFGDMDSNSISRYGIGGGSSGLPSSKVENMVFQKMIIEEQIKNIKTELEELDYAISLLSETQKEIIFHLINGTSISDIARKMSMKRKKVDYIRKKTYNSIYNIIQNEKNLKN